jgi:hypothetical protein
VKLHVDVKRAEQSYNFDSKETQSFVVVEAFGVELSIPVSDEQLQGLVAEHAVDGSSDAEALLEPTQPRRAPSTFVGPLVPEDEGPSFVEPGQAYGAAPEPPRRELRPMTRTPTQGSDDAGIAQG